MIITLTPELERALTEQAERQGTTPELLALRDLNALYDANASQPNVALRIPGLHAGQYQIADDFDAPLPDSFWLGTEGETGRA